MNILLVDWYRILVLGDTLRLLLLLLLLAEIWSPVVLNNFFAWLIVSERALLALILFLTIGFAVSAGG